MPPQGYHNEAGAIRTSLTHVYAVSSCQPAPLRAAVISIRVAATLARITVTSPPLAAGPSTAHAALSSPAPVHPAVTISLNSMLSSPASQAGGQETCIPRGP